MTKQTFNQELAGGIAENLGLSDAKRQWVWDYLKHYNKAADTEQPVDCREAFEKWASTDGLLDIKRIPSDSKRECMYTGFPRAGEYEDHETESHWATWQAAWKPERESGGWRSIETAPKDGTHILLMTADWGVVEGFWCQTVPNFYKNKKGWASYDPENGQGDWVSNWCNQDKERRLYCGQSPKAWMPIPTYEIEDAKP